MVWMRNNSSQRTFDLPRTFAAKKYASPQAPLNSIVSYKETEVNYGR